MKSKIMYQPSYSLLEVKLEKDEKIKAETGAMVSMSENIKIETGMQSGGIFGAITRTILGGESFFVNTFTAEGSEGEITFAPALSGDVFGLQLDGNEMYVQSGAYLAGEESVEVDTKWGGAKTFFSGEGLFMLRLSGKGYVFVASYGAIHQKELKEGEKLIIDTGHIVGFDSRMKYEVKRIGNWKSSIFSGEGLVVELTGPGQVLLQTRSFDAFMNYLVPKLPKETNRTN